MKYSEVHSRHVAATEWDSFQKYLKDLGVEELLSIHEKAYNRITKS